EQQLTVPDDARRRVVHLGIVDTYRDHAGLAPYRSEPRRASCAKPVEDIRLRWVGARAAPKHYLRLGRNRSSISDEVMWRVKFAKITSRPRRGGVCSPNFRVGSSSQWPPTWISMRPGFVGRYIGEMPAAVRLVSITRSLVSKPRSLAICSGSKVPSAPV